MYHVANAEKCNGAKHRKSSSQYVVGISEYSDDALSSVKCVDFFFDTKEDVNRFNNMYINCIDVVTVTHKL